MANAPVKLNDPVTGRKQLARVSRAVLHGYRSNNYTSRGLTPGIGLIDHRTGQKLQIGTGKILYLLFINYFEDRIAVSRRRRKKFLRC